MGNELYRFLTNDKKALLILYLNRIFDAAERSTTVFIQGLLFYSRWRLTGEMFGQMMLRIFRLASIEVDLPEPLRSVCSAFI